VEAQNNVHLGGNPFHGAASSSKRREDVPQSLPHFSGGVKLVENEEEQDIFS